MRDKICKVIRKFPDDSDGKESACNAGDASSIPESGRSSGGGNGHPFQYFCLGNAVDRGVWWTTVHGVTKSQTRLSMHPVISAKTLLPDKVTF